MKNPLSFLVQELLKANKITLDFDELEFQIQSHPTYPSLHAITGVLDHFNIENLALDVPIEIDTLNQLPNSFLAQIEINKQKEFVVVTKIKDNYKLIFDAKKKSILSQSEFLNQFTGILLAVEKDETTINSEKPITKLYLIKGLTLSCFIIFGLIFLLPNPDLANLSFLSLSVLGIYASTTILKQEQGESTILGDAFCSNPTEKKNCNAVLSSKAASIYKGLKLSDLSFMYFMGLALATFLLVVSNKTLFITNFISILALPITVYSIYYQSVVIKKWCILCLSIVTIIWCQAGLSIALFSPIYNLESILVVMLSFSFIITFWPNLSKVLKDNKSLKKMKVDYFKFKRNFELFNTQLEKSKVISTQIASKQEIVFGNTSSNLNITIITNPLCGHCKPVHKLVEQILNSYSNSCNLTIRFNINPINKENKAVQIATRLLEIYHVDGVTMCLKAMHDIYGDNSLEQWFAKWGFCTKPQAYLPTLNNEYSWCTDNAINFTPEILIKGKAYPKMFERNDLIYFIEDLEELSKINTPSIPFVRAQNV